MLALVLGRILTEMCNCCEAYKVMSKCNAVTTKGLPHVSFILIKIKKAFAFTEVTDGMIAIAVNVEGFLVNQKLVFPFYAAEDTLDVLISVVASKLLLGFEDRLSNWEGTLPSLQHPSAPCCAMMFDRPMQLLLQSSLAYVFTSSTC